MNSLTQTITTLLKSRAVIRLLSLGDQVAFSAANFILTILIARSYGDHEMAAYGIGLSVAMTLQGIQRSSYMVQNSVLAPAVLRKRIDKVTGQHITAGLLLLLAEIACFFIGALIWGDSDYYRLIALTSVVLTLLYFQLDFDRIVMLKHEKFILSCSGSVAYFFIILASWAALQFKAVSFISLMSFIGLYVVAKSAVFYSTLKSPSLFWGWRLLKRDTKRYLLPSLIGVVGYAGYSNMPIFILGSVAAPLQSAVFAAMRSLVQPLLVIIRSLDVVDKNFFSSSGMTRQQMKKSFWKLFMAYGALALGMIAVLGLAATPLVHMVYGEKYAPYAQLLIGWGMIFLMMALTSPIETIVVKTGRINTYNLYRIPAGIVGMVLAVALCPQYGAWGAVWACFAGWIVSVVGALYLIRRNIT